jgi:subtilisin family serine protease
VIRGLVAGLLGAVSLAAVTIPALPSTATDARFFVAHFDNRITDVTRARLERTGVMIIDYEPVNSYLVWATAEQAAAADGVRGIASVRAAGSARKLHDFLPSSGTVERLEVTVYGPAASDAASFLASFGTITNTYPIRADGLLVDIRVANVPVTSLDAIASHPAVLFASKGSLGAIPDDEATAQIQAGNIDAKANVPVPEYAAWLKRMKLDGSGVKVAIVDTGIDAEHPVFQDRVSDRIDYSLGEPTDTYGHGTHVAGIVGGMPGAGADQADSNGFLYGYGVAPKVKFVDQNAIGTTGYGNDPVTEPWPPSEGLQVLSADAWRAGAQLWNASWNTGEGSRAGYLATVRALDEMTRNADFEKKGSEEFLLVFSAGNTGASGPSAPHEAKNIIATGATNSGRGGNAGLGAPTDIDGIASFSSKGPTKDGRIFPTISAPGANVVSARARVGQACNTPPVDAGAQHYAFCSGTSMASPHAAGASALVHEWWKKRAGAWPSPAMVRALLVNSATDIGVEDIPNVNEGWGRINLGELFGSPQGEYVDQEMVFGGPREKKTYEVRVRSSKNPLKVTLAWSDAPAEVNAETALVNDLDLTVERIDGGRAVDTWTGNIFKNGQSAKGGKLDRLNNLENVYVLKPKPGLYRITIEAFNVPGDGIPFYGDKTDQDFALVLRAVI